MCLILMGFLLFVGQLNWKKLSTVRVIQHPSQSSTERYQLLESYMTENLSEINPTYKRIVFWNEVNHCYANYSHLKMTVYFETRLMVTKNMALDLDGMPCENMDAQFGSARLRIIALILNKVML